MSSPFVIREATIEDVPELVRLAVALAVYEKEQPSIVDANATKLYERNLFGPLPYAFALLAVDSTSGRAVGMAIYFFQFSTHAVASRCKLTAHRWTARPGLCTQQSLGRPLTGVDLEDLYVEEPYRGAGIGKAFFARLGRIAREKDCARMQWWVLKWNEPSIAFYRSLGAFAQPEWDTYRLEGKALADLEHVESRPRRSRLAASSAPRA